MAIPISPISNLSWAARASRPRMDIHKWEELVRIFIKLSDNAQREVEARFRERLNTNPMDREDECFDWALQTYLCPNQVTEIADAADEYDEVLSAQDAYEKIQSENQP